jgi:hypothetical protein
LKSSSTALKSSSTVLKSFPIPLGALTISGHKLTSFRKPIPFKYKLVYFLNQLAVMLITYIVCCH